MSATTEFDRLAFALMHGSTTDRKAAAGALADHGAASASVLIAYGLTDVDLGVRLTAGAALCRIADPDLPNSILADVTSPHAEVRALVDAARARCRNRDDIAVLEAHVRWPQATFSLLRATAHEDPLLVMKAEIQANLDSHLTRAGPGGAEFGVSPPPTGEGALGPVRAAAALLFEEPPGTERAAGLLQLLTGQAIDGAPAARQEAIWALGQLKRAEAARPLVSTLRGSRQRAGTWRLTVAGFWLLGIGIFVSARGLYARPPELVDWLFVSIATLVALLWASSDSMIADARQRELKQCVGALYTVDPALLTAALPDLRRLCSLRSSQPGEVRAAARELVRRIEGVQPRRSTLPVVGEPPTPDAGVLPRSAGPPDPELEALPVASSRRAPE